MSSAFLLFFFFHFWHIFIIIPNYIVYKVSVSYKKSVFKKYHYSSSNSLTFDHRFKNKYLCIYLFFFVTWIIFLKDNCVKYFVLRFFLRLFCLDGFTSRRRPPDMSNSAHSLFARRFAGGILDFNWSFRSIEHEIPMRRQTSKRIRRTGRKESDERRKGGRTLLFDGAVHAWGFSPDSPFQLFSALDSIKIQ